MGTNGGQYGVLSPWAEVDPIALKGISPRLSDLNGKKIGLLINGKRASRPILSVVERTEETLLNYKYQLFPSWWRCRGGRRGEAGENNPGKLD